MRHVVIVLAAAAALAGCDQGPVPAGVERAAGRVCAAFEQGAGPAQAEILAAEAEAVAAQLPHGAVFYDIVADRCPDAWERFDDYLTELLR